MFQEVQLDNVRAVRFDFVKAVVPKPLAGSWAHLSSQLLVSKETRSKDRRALWSPVVYAPGTTRANCNVEAVTCLVVDMDGEAFDHVRLDGLEYLAYTTWSHRPGDEHWHLVLPLKDPVPANMWSNVWAQLHERINVVGDPATKDPARIFYLPQHPKGSTPSRRIGHGALLDADVSGMFVPSRMVVSSKAAQSRTRKPQHPAADPAWWTETQPDEPYAGMSEREALEKFYEDWQEMKKARLAS